MVRSFEIIQTRIHHNRGLFIFARHLGEDHRFEVPEGSVLRDLRVYHYEVFQPPDGVFVFRPLDMERLFDDSFKGGEVVELMVLK